jgi:Trk K+ transport system NAD-binding subunit
MKAIIVGAGGTSREVLLGLAEHWDITVIDTDEERLEQATKVRGVEIISGDGSSRVILDLADISDADAVIATSNNDAVNLEVCRIALEAGVHQIAAVARDPDRLDEYRRLGVPAFSRARLTARRIEMQVEPRRVTSAAFADGLAEAIEFKITPDSPVINRPLKDLHSETWLIAAVLRDGSLIVPHGDTTLQTGDLVTVVGATSDYPAIVDLFTSGEARFPLDIGKKIITVAQRLADLEGHVAEAAGFIRASAAESLLVVHEDSSTTSDREHAEEIDAVVDQVADLGRGFEVLTRAVQGPPGRELARVAAEEGAGLIVLPSARRTGRGTRTRPSTALSLLRATGIPILLAAGNGPYERILVPARDTRSGEAAARAAMDLAVFGSAELRAVAVVPPPFLSPPGTAAAAQAAMGRIREDAAVHDVILDEHIIEGNPVRVLTAMCDEMDLLVIGVGLNRTPSRSLARYLARRVPISLLIVPDRQPTRA